VLVVFSTLYFRPLGAVKVEPSDGHTATTPAGSWKATKLMSCWQLFRTRQDSEVLFCEPL
jgi:hypothetical protein